MKCSRCEHEIHPDEGYSAMGEVIVHRYPDKCAERFRTRIKALDAELAEAVRLRDKFDGALATANDAARRRGERIKVLEAENERLKDAVEEEQEIANAFREPCVPLLKRINTLEAENAALREDKARLVEAVERFERRVEEALRKGTR